jgi:hypothetical protein
LFLLPGYVDSAWALKAVCLTQSREAAKPRREGAKGRWWWSVFEYEYEYRPPGRTEYEYEEVAWARGVVCGEEVGCGVSGPLTPDPSPPFHGGEGRISGQFSCRRMDSREAAKPRKGGGRWGFFEYEYEGQFFGVFFSYSYSLAGGAGGRVGC